MKRFGPLLCATLALSGCGDDAAAPAGGSSSATTSGGSCEGSTPAGDWTCVGQVVLPTTSRTHLALSLTPQTVVSIDDLTVKACAMGDTECASPLDQATTSTGQEVVLDVPVGADGFDGYLEWTGTGLETTLEVFYPRLVDDWSTTLLLYPTSYIDTLASSVGATLDPTRGILGFQAWDCATAAASGVAMSADRADTSSTLTYFIVGEAGPVASSTATTTSAEAFGLGGFLNVPAGPVELTATLAATCQVLAEVDVFVRAGALTAPSVGPLL
jgi:hypothetical protein